MQSTNKKIPEPNDEKEVFDWKLAGILLPILLIAPFITTGLIAVISGKLSTFGQMIVPIAGTIYGGILIYILYLWISKPIRDLSVSSKDKLLELVAGIIAKMIILLVLGSIGWFAYMVLTGQ